jgi:hypothetical protein
LSLAAGRPPGEERAQGFDSRGEIDVWKIVGSARCIRLVVALSRRPVDV